MSWQQINVSIRSEHLATIEKIVMEHGALSITYLDAANQPVFQKKPGSTPLWDNTILSCLFPADKNLQSLLWLLRAQPIIDNDTSLEIQLIEDKDWERSWMANFKAMAFGKTLWICPSWQEPPDPNAVNVMLDPGLAFGSGTHATTALCLRWLEQADLMGKHVIDYGCGSGVLAIAASLLGAATIHGVDNDPQAIIATIDNSQRNQINDAQLTTFLPQELPAMEADILLANILAEPLIDLAAKFSTLVKAGGQIVLSGILENQIDQVLTAYTPQFVMGEPSLEGDWVRLNGTRLY
ncbi:MAG TPA: 50S ribosomal protein L11 methyltransferase [Porticoccaceae bacterium]|jgi:ribosomal protein L11 methyltransferase|nr:50S ribosomal protein L11 methyltransferase [Gammaproteobacteria bacterium]HIL59720.1 50S ribosomal protein L11 methyltransferase [Porticoccaceae bacterium]